MKNEVSAMETTAEGAPPTLQAVYPETVCEVGLLGWHFAAIHAAWPHVLALAALRTEPDEEPEARVSKILRLLEEPSIYFASRLAGVGSGARPGTRRATTCRRNYR